MIGLFTNGLPKETTVLKTTTSTEKCVQLSLFPTKYDCKLYAFVLSTITVKNQPVALAEVCRGPLLKEYQL